LTITGGSGVVGCCALTVERHRSVVTMRIMNNIVSLPP
jgi:hypothetical protein